MLKIMSPDNLKQLRMLVAVALRYIRSDFGSGVDYQNWEPGGPSSIRLEDPALNFFVRVILETRCDRAIEIGSGNKSRTISLARIFPELDVVGLDIAPLFSEAHQHDNCQFDRFDKLDQYAAHGSIVLATGTLTCMSYDEVLALMRLVKASGAALAAVEPSRDEAGPRAGGTFYHELGAIAQNAGLTVWCDTLIAKNSFGLKMLENRQYLGCG